MIEISNKKVIVFDTNVKHSSKCKCKVCRTYRTLPKAKLLLPLEIKKYFPILIINPFISFIFISKLFDVINSKYLDVSFDTSNITIDSQIMELLNSNFSNNFINCINFIINKDIFNTVGFFEESLDKFNDFEMFYLSGLINFYLQNLDKSFDSLSNAFEILFKKSLEEPINNLDVEYVHLFFLFDLMVVSLYFKKYDIFGKIFEYLIRLNNDFSLYSFMLYIFLFFYIYDSYVLLENIATIKENIEVINRSIDEFWNPNVIRAYILYIMLSISIYRPEVYNILKNELNIIVQNINPATSNIEDHINIIKNCVELDKDNILYKLALHSIDKNIYKDFISSLEFLPLNKTISNFVDYVKFSDIVVSKLILQDIGFNINFVKLRELVESEPNNPFFWFINGLYNFVNMDFDVANNYFRGAVATDNSFTEARIFFATTLFLTGDIEKSLKILENSLNTYTAYLFDIILINMSVIYKITNKEEFIQNIYNELSNLESVEILQDILKEVENEKLD
ncbi:MAG: hypothetical protein RMJ36_01460 [Candidatus Calescibacterium sp.]|nr:hypothetical protein [Candidatus Calescibacterium sp.]MDW8132307.1 hypothetical protein [Candidatus Calescibacterium sp.]